MSVAFDSADYALRWPRDLFARELSAVNRTHNSSTRRARLRQLIQEAFVGPTPMEDFNAAAYSHSVEKWANALAARAPELPVYYEPSPYWPARQDSSATTSVEPVDSAQARRNFRNLVHYLYREGFLASAFRIACLLDQPKQKVQSQEKVDAAAVLGGRLNREGLWPLQPDTWDDDIFFGLIEVFHDLVSRPRQRDEHWLVWHNNQWIECEEDEEENEDQEKLCHHFTDFSIGVGRALYRWHINTLLKNERIDLRLAESGEDIGRLVRATDDARAELVKRALITPDARVSTRGAHAIALFRSRTASEQNKRSAVPTWLMSLLFTVCWKSAAKLLIQRSGAKTKAPSSP